MSDKIRPMATCPHDGAPLISTMAFRKAEFYCLECGRRLGFFSPRARKPTAALRARHEALKAEWDEHAGTKLLAGGGWREGCGKCRVGVGEPHHDHATAKELAAHEAALAWLRERAEAKR